MYNNNYNGLFNQQPMKIGLKGRPVSSLEEVRAAQIDFDGSVFIFPDFANNRIYTKQINLDGTASLNMYCIAEIPTIESQYVTKEEFNNTLQDLKKTLSSLSKEEFNF